jgi:hypothetical protein
MILQRINRVLVVAVLMLLPLGCGKASSGPATAVASAPQAQTIARIHWLGKTKVLSDVNASYLSQLWNLPESLRLQEQTLDKLSLAPWLLLRGETNSSSTNLLRPLLADLVENESWLEISQPADSTNAPAEMVLAIRLDGPRAGLWQTNLAKALESLTSIQPVPSDHGWSLKKHHAPNLIEMTRVGDWTVLGAAVDHNTLLDDVLARIQRDHAPFDASATNLWLEGQLNLPRLASMLGIAGDFTTNLPNVSFKTSGDSGKVLTRGELTLPDVLAAKLDPWNIPTNLMDGELSSFTAVRGWKPGFLSRFWNQFETNPAPNQFYVWGRIGPPMQTYFAAPVADASNAVSQFSDFALRKAGPWIATNDLALFQRATKFNGLEWKGIPFISPVLKSVETPGGGFFFGGFCPPARKPSN